MCCTGKIRRVTVISTLISKTIDMVSQIITSLNYSTYTVTGKNLINEIHFPQAIRYTLLRNIILLHV